MASRWLVINERNEVVVDEGWEWCRVASADLLHFRTNGQEGLYDWKNRKFFMHPRYKSFLDIVDSILIVEDEGYCHLVDLSGKRIGGRTFWNIKSFVDGYAAAAEEKDGPYGFINLAGEWVIRPAFYHVQDFSEGLSAVWKDSGELCYIDRHGDAAIPGPFMRAESFSEGLAPVRTADGDHYINKAGKIVLSGGEEWFSGGAFYCGRADVMSRRHPEKVFFIETNGRMVGETFYDKSGRFSENVAPVAMNNKWGLIDLEGRLILPYSIDRIETHCCGLAAASSDERDGYIDTKGEWVIPPQYTFAGIFHPESRLACVEVE